MPSLHVSLDLNLLVANRNSLEKDFKEIIEEEFGSSNHVFEDGLVFI